MIVQAPEQSLRAVSETSFSRKISVTYILGSFRDAGAERQAAELMKRLDRRKFTVSLILLEDVGLERLPDLDKFEVLNVAQAGASRWVRRAPSLLRALVRTQRWLSSWRTDILHAFLPGPSIVAAFAGRIARVPIVIGSRRSLPDFYRNGRGLVAGAADTLALRLSHLNLGNSAAVSAGMISVGCPVTKCRTIFNGVDTTRFRPDIPRTWRGEMGWSADDIVVGMVANFRACKRHCDFVDAAFRLSNRNPRLKFVMVGGDHGNRAEIEEQIKILQLQHRVLLVGSQPCPERVFAALDIYVCASETEGFSNVLLEALSCGKPVVATKVGGNPEIIAHGENGLLVPPLSPESLAAAIEVLIADPGKRSRMGSRGRELVQQKFSLERMVSEHEQLYASLVNA